MTENSWFETGFKGNTAIVNKKTPAFLLRVGMVIVEKL